VSTAIRPRRQPGAGARPSRAWLGLLVVLVAAAVLRFHGLNWDSQIGAHPDERYIVDVASRLSFPDGLNPFAAAPRFPYGHLPLYLLALAHALAPAVDPLLVGRALSASFDLGTVLLTFGLGRRVYGEREGLLAAAFVGLMVAHVQQAHFYTPDTLLIFFVVGALLFAVRFAQNGHALDLCVAGGAAGLALGTKATAGLLAIPLSVACWSASKRPGRAVWRWGAAALLSFLLVDPYALVELPTFVRNLARQGAILRGALDVPYTRQYHGTLPYVYPILQQLRWGMGWLLGSCAFAGLALEAVRAVRRPPRPGQWILLAWVIPSFFFVGGLYAKFPRYLLPILPLLALHAARLITDLARWRRFLPVVVSVVVLASLCLRCLALAGLYRAPHPWVTASDWLYEHAERGSTIAVEAWDHPLPVRATGYELMELPIFEEETAEKWDVMDAALEEADYVVVASRRGYASLARWPGRYARTARYYERLFEGVTGFEAVACFGRFPRVGPSVMADDPTAGLGFSLPEACQPEAGRVLRPGRLDESFVVYDHPQVIVFRALE